MGARVGVNNEYRCTQIKDRNGNYISATYDYTTGHLLTIRDTLDRLVTLVYNAENNLQAIRQTWAGQTHDWATFNYCAVFVSPGFDPELMVNGPDGNNVTVLTQVNLHDGSYFTFNYNAAFGQVYRINRYAADNHLLEYTSYNLDTSAGQTDCPRFTERRDWAQNWNDDVDGQPVAGEEAVTAFAVASDSSWSKVTFPDLTIHKEFFATSVWRNGLTTSSKDYVNAAAETSDTPKKTTTTTWTQDDENLTYSKNPRVAQTDISDAEGNQKRIAINYGAYASYSLPFEVTEYSVSGGTATALRRTQTDYNLSSPYVASHVSRIEIKRSSSANNLHEEIEFILK